MVCALYCSADGSGLLILLLVKGFHAGFHAVMLSGWQWNAHTSARQWLSHQFVYRIALWMAADCSYFRLSIAFTTVRVPYGSADGIGLLIPQLVNSFHDGLHAVLLSGWQWIAQTSTLQWLSRWFEGRSVQRIAAYCSFFHSSMAFTVCTPFSSADGSASLVLPVVNVFHGLRTALLSGLQGIAYCSAR